MKNVTGDVLAVMWREFRQAVGNAWSYLAGYGIIVAMYGVILPWGTWRSIMAGDFRTVVMTLSFSGLVIGGGFAATSFTGEREARTLHALLATRITDSGLFLGKTLFVVAAGYSAVLLTALLQLVTVNVASAAGPGQWRGIFVYQDAPLALAYQVVVPLGLLILSSGTGVFISLRTRTTRGMFLQNLAINAPLLGALYWGLGRYFEHAGALLGMFVAVVTVASALVFRLSVARFNRENLILIG